MATNQPEPVYVTDTYQPMRTRARAASALLWLCAALSVVAVISDLLEYSLLGRFERGDFASRAEAIEAADASDDRQGVIGIGQTALVVVTGAVFIAWFYGMYKNLRAMGRGTRYGTGWAIGGWFVPFLGFWRPKQIADEIYRSSNPDMKPDEL